MVWSTRCLAGVSIVALSCAATHARADGAAAPAGYAEVAIPNEASAVAIVPRPDVKHSTQGYAIETLSGTRHVPSLPAATSTPAADPRTALPSGPPIVVFIRFDPRRAGTLDRARTIEAVLRQDGITVSAVQPTAFPVSDGVAFAFAEDAAAAASVAHRLPDPLSRFTPVRAEARDLTDPAPGTVEITLGGDRRTS